MIKSCLRKALDSLSSLRRLTFSVFRASFYAAVPPNAAPQRSLNLQSRFCSRFLSALVGASSSIKLRLNTPSKRSRKSSSVPCTFNCLKLGASSSSSQKSVLRILYLNLPTTAGLVTSPKFSYLSLSSFSFFNRSASNLTNFFVSSASCLTSVGMISTCLATNLSYFASACCSINSL